MIQRNLLRASRSLQTNLPHRTFAAPLRRSSPLLRSSVFQPSRSLPPSTGRIEPRWYSDAAAAKEEAKTDGAEKPAAEAQSSEVENLKKSLEAKNKEVIDLKDQYLRAIADYRNLQDRTVRETKSAKDFALQKFARDLIPSIDTLSLALTSIPAEKLTSPSSEATAEAIHKDLLSLHQGLNLTEDMLMGTLSKHGLTRFDPAIESENFDPNRHEAVFQAPMQGKEDGTVFHTQQKGYSLNGRVLRAAQVGVVKNS